jgi:hypothetical protein
MLSVEPDRLDTHRTDQSIMAQAHITSLFFGTILATLVATASPAQDAGVSGIPPGPGNVNGLNGSIRDPSGVGNAARMPALPQPSIRPATPTTMAPLNTTRPALRQRLVRSRATRPQRTRLAAPHAQHGAERAAVRENDRLLKHGVTSICRGC